MLFKVLHNILMQNKHAQLYGHANKANELLF